MDLTPDFLRLRVLHENIRASEEIMHMHSETTETIRFIKNNMLQYIYYSLALQAALVAYYEALDINSFSPFIFLLMLVSLLVAFTCERFTAKYFYSYKFLQYRLECYIEPKLSLQARMVMDKPIFKKIYPEHCTGHNEFIEEYKDFICRWSDPFQRMYILANWAACLFVLYHLSHEDITKLLPGSIIVNGPFQYSWVLIVLGLSMIFLCYNYSPPQLKLLKTGLFPQGKREALERFETHLKYVNALDSFIGKPFSEIELRKELNR